MLTSVSQAMTEAVARGIFPGAVLLVRYQGKVLLHKAYGHASLVPHPVAMTEETVFDIASLTKPVATATAVMHLIADDLLSVEDKVWRYLPDFHSGEKSLITILDLLNHTSGLPDWRPFYREISFRDTTQPGFLGSPEAKELMYHLVHQEPLSFLPGTQSLYSDLDFILLGEIIEVVSGMPLDLFCHERIFSPLGMERTFFLPSGKEPPGEQIFAATEDCPWRGQVVQGRVHDENASAMGGVAGHAGLFSTARDLNMFLSAILDSANGHSALLPPLLVRQFLARQNRVPNSTWALGWDTPSPVSSAGRHFTSLSFGHLGFTGVSLWADRETDLAVILLTNRIHPTRTNTLIQEFRPRLHDIIAENSCQRKKNML